MPPRTHSDLPEPSCHQREGHRWSLTPLWINPPSTPARLGRGGRLTARLQAPEEPTGSTVPSLPSKAQHAHPQTGHCTPYLLNEVIYRRGFADTPRAHSQGRPVAAIPLSVYLFIDRYLCRVTHPRRHSYHAHTLKHKWLHTQFLQEYD